MASARSPHAVLLDAGFTLVEPRRPVADLYLEGAQKTGAQVDPEAFRRQLESCWVRRMELWGDARDLRSSEEIESQGWFRFTRAVAAPFPQLLRRHHTWLAGLVRQFDAPATWQPLPGAALVLQQLRAQGLTLGVVSNWHGALLGILEELELTPLLDFILISSQVGWRKPHEIIFQEALRLAGTRAEDTVHVGDSLEDDVQGARACGIRPVLMDQKHRGRREPVDSIARIKHLPELLPLLGMA